jgi:dihydrofolate reductase
MSERKLILYIAASLDGYIATKDDNLDFLRLVEQKGEDYGYAKFIKTVDTVIMGRKTYDKVLSFGIGFPHANKECYILTRTQKPSEENIHFYNRDIVELINQLKSKKGKNIFCDGGAETVHLLLKNKLIDELIISIVPVLLSNGIRLFNGEQPQQNLHFISSKSFEKGLVQLHYKLGE